MSLFRTLLAGVAVAFATSALASDDNPPFEATVIVEGTNVTVEDEDGASFDLVDGAQMVADGVIEDGDVITVERVVKNPRTVVALEDTHF